MDSDNFLKLAGCQNPRSACRVITKHPIVGISVEDGECARKEGVFTCSNGDVFMIENEGSSLRFITGDNPSCHKSLTVKVFNFDHASSFADAVAVAEKIEDSWLKSFAIYEVVGAMAEGGLFDKAQAVVGKIEDKRIKSLALYDIAQATGLALVKKTGKEEYISIIPDETEKIDLLSQLLNVVEKIEDDHKRSSARDEIAKTMAKAKFMSQTVQVTCATPTYKVYQNKFD